MITTKHITDFLKAIDDNEFFKAHEVFEELWFPKRFEDSNEVKILKGFINAAVSFELIKRGRPTQSKTPWSTYLKYRKYIWKLDSKQQVKYSKISSHIELKQKSFL